MMTAAAPRQMVPATTEDVSASRVLDAIPMRNAAVRSEPKGNALVLWVPVEQRWWTRHAFALGLPVRKEKGIELDELGQEVWQACDGKRPVERIVEDFAAHHQLRFHEARLSVLTFLRSLVDKKLIVLAVPNEVGALGSKEERS